MLTEVPHVPQLAGSKRRLTQPESEQEPGRNFGHSEGVEEDVEEERAIRIRRRCAWSCRGG